MKQNATQDILNKKPFVIIICAIGILAVSYGMLAKNNLVFIIGIVCIIGGYLLVRRRLKHNHSGK
jgi:uncharacterized membrane protein YjjP (DUF1212 family)